jgi:hypothetical protein
MDTHFAVLSCIYLLLMCLGNSTWDILLGEENQTTKKIKAEIGSWVIYQDVIFLGWKLHIIVFPFKQSTAHHIIDENKMKTARKR